MKPGNILSGNIEELGVLTNPVVAEEV